MGIEIRKIVIIREYHGPDRCHIVTGMPSAIVGNLDVLTLDFIAARDTGISYVEKNFPGVPVEVIVA